MAKTPVIIYDLPFECVKLSEADFNDFAAIYVILCVENGKSTVLDVGQSGQVGTRIDHHTREECWKEKCPSGNIWVCIYKTPTKDLTKEERIELEGKIRDYYKPQCGER